MDKNKIKQAIAFGVIGCSLSITKNIEVPSTDQKEIGEIINLHANRQTPYRREEIIVDYLNIGTHHLNYTKILQAIVTIDFVRKKTDILENAGLELHKIFFGPEAISSFYTMSGQLRTKTSPKILLNIDSDSADFIVVFKGNPVFVRNMPIGREQLLEKSVSCDAFAEEVKKSMAVYTKGQSSKYKRNNIYKMRMAERYSAYGRTKVA